MATQGNVIAAADYTSIRTLVAKILGPASSSTYPGSTYGYGLTPTAPAVSAGDIITQAQWAALQVDILKAAGHQGSVLTNLSALALTTSTLVQAADINKFVSAATTIDNNRLAVAAGQASNVEVTPVMTSSRTARWGSPGTPTVTHIFTLSWSSGEYMRDFFNAGGEVKFSAARSGGTGTTQNTSWTDMLAAIGTVTFKASGTVVSGQGTASGSIGTYQVTGTNQQIYYKGGGSTYTANDYNIYVQGTANTLTFTIIFNDDAKNANPLYDVVDGTLTSAVSLTVSTGLVNHNTSPFLPTGTTVTPLSYGGF